MSNYDNTNSGIIGKNTRKQSESHPDITGSINIEGVEYFLDGWKKDRKDGTGSFYSLKAKRKDRQPDAGVPDSKAGRDLRGNTADDEVPW